MDMRHFISLLVSLLCSKFYILIVKLKILFYKFSWSFVLLKTILYELGVVTYTCNPSSKATEAGGLQIWGQLALYYKTLSNIKWKG